MSLRVLDVVRNNGVAQEMRPAHWANASGTNFKNPWSSFREMDWTDGKWVRGVTPLRASEGTDLRRIDRGKPLEGHGAPSRRPRCADACTQAGLGPRRGAQGRRQDDVVGACCVPHRDASPRRGRARDTNPDRPGPWRLLCTCVSGEFEADNSCAPQLSIYALC